VAHDSDNGAAVIREAQLMGSAAIDRRTLGGDLLQDAGPVEARRPTRGGALHERDRTTTHTPARQVPQRACAGNNSQPQGRSISTSIIGRAVGEPPPGVSNCPEHRRRAPVGVNSSSTSEIPRLSSMPLSRRTRNSRGT